MRPTLPSNLMDEVHATYGESFTRAWIDDIHTDICQARVVPRSVGRTCGKPVDKRDPFLHRRALSELRAIDRTSSKRLLQLNRR